MKSLALLLTTIQALLLAETDAETLLQLNRNADRAITAYDLDKAEPFLEQAVNLATRLSPSEEIKARSRLANLYLDLQKRDGRDWRNLAIPHLLRGIELSKGVPSDLGNQLAIQLALAIIQLPPNGQKADLSPQFGKFAERLIAQIEKSAGPLSPRTAAPYHALIYSAAGSEGQVHAEYACAVLAGSTEAPAPDFAPLLLECAEMELRNLDESSAVNMARVARKAASLGGPRYANETVLSYLIEAEAGQSLMNHVAAETALDEAARLAAKTLSLRHELWGRIDRDRAPLSTRKGELIRRFSPVDELLPDARIQPAKPLTKVEPEYTKQARIARYEGTAVVAVLITTDGKGKVFNSFQSVPLGLNASVEKAISEWTFQPWTKDGRPVPGMSIIEVKFQPKN